MDYLNTTLAGKAQENLETMQLLVEDMQEAVSYDGLRPWGIQHGKPLCLRRKFLCSKVCQFELPKYVGML